MGAPFDGVLGQRVSSILVQCLCQHQLNTSIQSQSDNPEPAWTEAFLMRPSTAGSTDFQVVEDSRVIAFRTTLPPSKDMSLLSYRWGANDPVVSMFQPGDLFAVEAKVKVRGNGLLIGWTGGEICISSITK